MINVKYKCSLLGVLNVSVIKLDTKKNGIFFGQPVF